MNDAEWMDDIPPERIIIAVDFGMRTEMGTEYTHVTVKKTSRLEGYGAISECVIDGEPVADTLYEAVKMLIRHIDEEE